MLGWLFEKSSRTGGVPIAEDFTKISAPDRMGLSGPAMPQDRILGKFLPRPQHSCGVSQLFSFKNPIEPRRVDYIGKPDNWPDIVMAQVKNKKGKGNMSITNIQPDGWAPAKGYANGMLTSDGTLHVGGQIGWNQDQVFECHDFVGQMEQTLHNIADIVRAAGGDVADIARLTWYITDKKEYLAKQKEVGTAYRNVLGRHYPAMSVVVVKELIEDDALIEIEAIAHIK